MKDRKYAVSKSGLTVQLPFSTATVGWKPLAVLTAVFLLLAAVFVFAAVIAIRVLVFLTILGLMAYVWFRVRRLRGGGSPPGAGTANLRPRPTPTRVGGGEEEFPEE